MKKNWVLSQESFDALLDWLDPDREQAGQKYEDVRQRLVRIFASRSCYEAEDLADETLNRVANKVQKVRDSFAGDPAVFFYAVGNKVYMEYMRRKPQPAPPLLVNDAMVLERQSRCLEVCLDRLTAENRELVIQYYRDEKIAKINRRKRLAEQLGIAPNALRIRAHRIRAQLQNCVDKCLDREN
jgi:DNA-directed RNA polymerase specialized sigma24 family protein